MIAEEASGLGVPRIGKGPLHDKPLILDGKMIIITVECRSEPSLVTDLAPNRNG